MKDYDDKVRVAFFTDTFNEINGVALTSRQLTSFALRKNKPFLCVRGGTDNRQTQEGSVTHLELARGPLSFDLDKGLRHDPMLWRHHGTVAAAVKEFKPDVIHVVSPGDVSEIGVYIARTLQIPLAISWHTNLHEFGAMRLKKMFSWGWLTDFSEAQILNALIVFYKLGDVLYAPNDELVDMLVERTGKPVFLMKRGIDTALFTPAKRTVNDGILRLGYVGRITPEKSVRFLQTLDEGLRKLDVPPFRFLIVGDGSERDWLLENLKDAELPGILRGEELAHAYANMDVFTFPSRTDTFGNVVLEAFASGVPAVVTDAGGPKFIVRNSATGFVAHSDEEFINYTARLLQNAAERKQMGDAARVQASGESWDAVFEKVYDGYQMAQNKAVLQSSLS
jgi:glycosyltransferase involved in cell wall biosynthesis